MDTYARAYDEKIRPLMDKIDQARSLLSSDNDGITLPSVVVVGDQSSGKSTLLESLSLVELPKGSGIVTRCPLVLRLRSSYKRQVYRVHENQRFPLDEKNMNILKYIEEETRKLAGTNKNIVSHMIELQVEDPDVRDLTVVDLPGIARNPIADQPKDIHKQTTDLIRKFIRPEGTVILCVFPANVDIATVESFTLAREVDPKGIRTIGVITKSDLASNQDAFIQQLLMKNADVLQLTLGFVAVRNRSSNENISLNDARIREKNFFQEHPAATIVGWHCLGINALIKRLADLYSDRVRETFPKMRNEIETKLKDVYEQLSKFPPNLDTPAERLAKYYELADFYVENILKVRFLRSNDDQHRSMANMLHIRFQKFNEIIEKHTKELFSPRYRSKIRDAMGVCHGEQLPNFLPQSVLNDAIFEKVDRLWEITTTLINECFHITCKLLLTNDTNECKDNILLRKLLPGFREAVNLHLNEKKDEIHNQLKELIRLEKHPPYTMNHYYMNKIDRFKNYLELRRASNNNEKNPSAFITDDDDIMFDSALDDGPQVQEMLISILSYWRALTIRFTDYAALTLRAGFDFDVCSDIRNRLRRIPTEQCDFVDSYLAEDTFMKARRLQLQQTKQRLEKVYTILGGHVTKNIGKNAFIDPVAIENDPSMTLDALSKSTPDYNFVLHTKSTPTESVLTSTTTNATKK